MEVMFEPARIRSCPFEQDCCTAVGIPHTICNKGFWFHRSTLLNTCKPHIYSKCSATKYLLWFAPIYVFTLLKESCLLGVMDIAVQLKGWKMSRLFPRRTPSVAGLHRLNHDLSPSFQYCSMTRNTHQRKAPRNCEAENCTRALSSIVVISLPLRSSQLPRRVSMKLTKDDS